MLANDNLKARLIAYYLPQYHPIPENDEWWGKGFTEWTNVAKARPLFRGHYQPRLPGELGFYDLRVPETRETQAQLAREHGIEGFCYWHYWLGGGKILLQRPFEEVLASGKPDFPFCLGWANHSWTGIWFGAPDKTLCEQTYPGLEDHLAHFDYLLKAFKDPRYITVEGKPLLHIFRPYEIPNIKSVMDLWRELALENGLTGLYIVGEGITPLQVDSFGLDGLTYSRHRHIAEIKIPKYNIQRRFLSWYRKTFRKPAHYLYKDAMKYFFRDKLSASNHFPSIITNWDSTPRLGWQGVVLKGVTPNLFRAHVRKIIQAVSHKDKEHRLIFVKSWNEWAEGNYLEPDQRYGRAFLEVLRDEML
ncbi:MAG: glycoside hydrolase family 99-like domain-containing protein [Anaerolineales bacterium]|nr:MAG: glycoside hydrolase family 99-like domain-containing protein [Anaerolineales bacterium]